MMHAAVSGLIEAYITEILVTTSFLANRARLPLSTSGTFDVPFARETKSAIGLFLSLEWTSSPTANNFYSCYLWAELESAPVQFRLILLICELLFGYCFDIFHVKRPWTIRVRGAMKINFAIAIEFDIAIALLKGGRFAIPAKHSRLGTNPSDLRSQPIWHPYHLVRPLAHIQHRDDLMGGNQKYGILTIIVHGNRV